VAEIETEERCLNFVPDSLKLLLEGILVSKDVGLKLASTGQAIMQAVRPRGLPAPLQVVLGIQLHHHFASRFLIDSLCATGSVVPIKKCKGLEKMPQLIKELMYPTVLPSLFSMSQIMLITT